MRGQVLKNPRLIKPTINWRVGGGGEFARSAQAHRVPRNQRSSYAMISIVLLSGDAKTAENPIMESACNYGGGRLVRASQHARDSNGVRERTRASALIYFTSREGERMLHVLFHPSVFLLSRHRCLYDVASLRSFNIIQLSSSRPRDLLVV